MSSFALLIVYVVLSLALGQDVKTTSLAYEQALQRLTDDAAIALNRLAEKATTEECRTKIFDEYNKYTSSLFSERPYPFEQKAFFGQCLTARPAPMQPFRQKMDPEYPRPIPSNISRLNDDVTIDPENLAILYVILTHQHPEFTIRIIEALQEAQHTFVVHVDAKAPQEVNDVITAYAKSTVNVFVTPTRADAIWGAFSIVNATLIGFKTGFDTGRHFDFVVDFSGSSYPIKSNAVIRETFSRRPNGIFMEIKPEPNFPPPEMWYNYVECDGYLHRIARITMARGINMFTGSQWFALPRHVAQWFLEDPLPISYAEYAEHIVVADENYFATMVKNSPYCSDQINRNLHYLIFTKWENEFLSREDRDLRKCMLPDPDHCGRSPTTLTMGMKNEIEMTYALFARKFDPTDKSSLELLAHVDSLRTKADIAQRKRVEEEEAMLIIVANDKTFDENKQLSLSETHQCVRLPSVLGKDVEIVPCDTSDLNQHFVRGNCMQVDEESYQGARYAECPTSNCHIAAANASSEFCQLRGRFKTGAVAREQGVDPDDDVCLDIRGASNRPGSPLIGWACIGQWNQFFRLANDCRLFATQADAVGKVRGTYREHTSLCAQAMGVMFNGQLRIGAKTSTCKCDASGEPITKPMLGGQEFFYYNMKHDPPRNMKLNGGRFVAVEPSTANNFIEESTEVRKQRIIEAIQANMYKKSDEL